MFVSARVGGARRYDPMQSFEKVIRRIPDLLEDCFGVANVSPLCAFWSNERHSGSFVSGEAIGRGGGSCLHALAGVLTVASMRGLA